MQNDKVKRSSTQRCKTIKIDKNFLIEVLKLKRQRLIIDLKSANLDIYHNRNFKKFKNWIHNTFNTFEINLIYFNLNKLRSAKFSSLFVTRCFSAKIIRKKRIWKSYRKSNTEKTSWTF